MSAQVTVLCIDDEETGLKLRKILFERQGHRVFTAPDGPSGIDLFKTQPIDAVVVDYRMPNMDGAVVAEKLKELRPRVPIIMLSGDNDVPDGAKQTVDAFVTKGESPAVLLKDYGFLVASSRSLASRAGRQIHRIRRRASPLRGCHRWCL
jgi:CheY-like chemotaxis protein